MYIVSDDGEVMVKLTHLSVENGPGDQYNIEHTGTDMFRTHTIMATFSSKRRAKQEMQNVIEAFKKGKKFYKMCKG